MTSRAGANMVMQDLVFAVDAPTKVNLNLNENLHSYSEDFSQPQFGKGRGAYITTNAATAPDGTLTASKLYIGSDYLSDIPLYTYQNQALVAGVPYTQSIYLKAAEFKYGFVWFDNGSGFGMTVEVNLKSGNWRVTRTSGDNAYYTSMSANVTHEGNDWYRVAITGTPATGQTNTQLRVYPTNIPHTNEGFGQPNPSFLNNGGIYVWGIQTEQSPYVRDYVKTSGAVVNRSWKDVSGNNYNLQLVNYPIFNGKAMQFRDTTLQYAFTSFDEGVMKYSNKNGQWTLEAMFKIIGNGVGESIVFGRPGCHGGIYMGGGANVYCAMKTTEPNCWIGAVNHIVYSGSYGDVVHIVFAYNNGSVKFYVNGKPGTLNSSATFNTSTYNIAYIDNAIHIGSTSGFRQNNDIYTARAYKRELTAAEVESNYYALRGRFGV
jgi:hypothetical protein